MKKAVKIIAIVLTLSLLVFAIISYCIWKEQTQQVIAKVVDYINRPLPIIGVSIAIIGAFIFKCFVASKYGKKALKEYKDALDETKREVAEKEKEIEKIQEQLKGELEQYGIDKDKIKEILGKSLELSKNVKIKRLANELKGETYGEEEVKCGPEEETL